MDSRSHSGFPLWNGDAPNRDLRLPNTPLASALKDETKIVAKNVPEKTQPPPVKSILSAEAQEFVPSFLKNQPTASFIAASPNSVQDRLRKHKVQEPDENINLSMPSPIVYNGEFEDSLDDMRLRHIIDTLTKDPMQFPNLLDLFMDTLFPYYEDIMVLSRTNELLVKQAIDFPSFRQTAAKLCCCIEQFCPAFRAGLHITCEKELMKENTNKSGILLFAAELYTQLHHENIYGKYLIDAFKHLLSIGGNDNLKAICQAIKLTGRSLELYDKNALDHIFAMLSEIKPTVTGTVLSLINSVTALRSSHWGGSPADGLNSEPETYWGETSNTVFYNTEGLKLTSEESDFLAANATEEYLTDVSDPDELWDPEPEMDEEIQAAFKDFIKLSKR